MTDEKTTFRDLVIAEGVKQTEKWEHELHTGREWLVLIAKEFSDSAHACCQAYIEGKPASTAFEAMAKMAAVSEAALIIIQNTFEQLASQIAERERNHADSRTN